MSAEGMATPPSTSSNVLFFIFLFLLFKKCKNQHVLSIFTSPSVYQLSQCQTPIRRVQLNYDTVMDIPQTMRHTWFSLQNFTLIIIVSPDYQTNND